MSLTIMQLLSVLFKCKIYYLSNYYFRIFKPVLGLLFEHTLIILSIFVNSFKHLSEAHYYGNHFLFQLPRSLPKFLTRLPFFSVLVVRILFVGVQIHTSF